jgi:23S rRNA (adenine2503-C2)-methyltransferase
MNIKKLENFLKENNQPEFRLKQIQKAVFQDGEESFEEVSTLPLELRQALGREIKILPFKSRKFFVSGDGRAVKALITLEDGSLIESVLIAAKPDVWSVCVSSQVGCPLGCLFCATGKNGFKRNLSTEEIASQVLMWRQYLKKKKDQDISTIVFMGTGEPFLNWEDVAQSLGALKDPDLFNIGSRNISISTVGVENGIEKFSEEFPQMNLAVSLHFAEDEKRNQYIPANRNYDLEKLKTDLKNYFQENKRKVFMEYILLDGINDSQKDAENLVKYLESIGMLKLLHVNLIHYNASPEDEFGSSDKKTTKDFCRILENNNIHFTTRKSLGEDIQGACGQLAGQGIK